MIGSKSRLYFLLLFLLVATVIMFFVLRPFLAALVLAAVFALVCRPLFLWILKFFPNWPNLSAVITIILVLVFVFVPLFLIGWQILGEGQQLYFGLSSNFSNLDFSSVLSRLGGHLGGLDLMLGNLSFDFNQYLRSGLNFLLGNLSSIFFNLAQIVTELFVFLFAFYYLLRDGEKIKKALIKVSPLNRDDDEVIIDKISLAVNAVIKGSLLVALIQGLVLALGLLIFDVPNPVLWGGVATIGALIPMVGATIVALPVATYLYWQGQMIAAVGVLLWGVLLVGLVDNLIRPSLVGRGMSLHPLLVLLSVLGGLSFFGPFGFIFGPLVATLFMVLLDICSVFISKQS